MFPSHDRAGGTASVDLTLHETYACTLLDRRSVTDFEVYADGASIGTDSTDITGSTNVNENIYLGCQNNNGTAGNFSGRQLAFWACGDSLTDAEAIQMTTDIEAFQVELGNRSTKNVANIVQAFKDGTGITDATITSALTTLVTSMIADGTWDLCHAFYPDVGGSYATVKMNLKDPRNEDSAYRLEENGTINYASNGVTRNGS